MESTGENICSSQNRREDEHQSILQHPYKSLREPYMSKSNLLEKPEGKLSTTV
jgi:hypothetical protein